jgi:hypothetical protein
MTPKEKAKELYYKYWNMLYELNERVIPDEISEQAKQCALICVDEELKLIHRISHQLDNDNYIFIIEELLELKQEIEKL